MSKELKILIVRVTAGMGSLQQEIEAGNWVTAQIIADAIKAHITQVEHHCWFQAKMEQSNKGV